MNDIIYIGKHTLTYNVSRHAHNSCELIYCTRGCGDFQFDGETLHYEENDLVVIPASTPHSNYSSGGFTNIHINLLDPTTPIRSPFVIHDDSNHFLLNAFTAAFYHFSTNDPYRSMLLSAYGNLISAYLAAYQTVPSRSSIVEEVEKTIIHNFPDADFELDAYLESLPFSYDYLRKVFKKEIGVTPHKYLTDKRLQAAEASLCSAAACGQSISEIAMQCGFRDPLYFSRVFKKRYGISPSQFQQQSKTGPDTPPDSDSMKIML